VAWEILSPSTPSARRTPNDGGLNLLSAIDAAFDWKAAMNQFAILHGERFTLAEN